jgi:hypothetical protein
LPLGKNSPRKQLATRQNSSRVKATRGSAKLPLA